MVLLFCLWHMIITLKGVIMTGIEKIDVTIKRRDDWFIAESEQILGLFVCDKDLKRVYEAVPHVISALIKVQHNQHVDVS